MRAADVEVAPRRQRARRNSPWRHREFTALFVGATLSRLATEMYSVAVVLFVLARLHSPQVAGLTASAATLPTVVTGPVVGAWLDRTRLRRAVFLVSPLVLAAAMAAFLLLGSHPPAAAVIALGFVAGLPSPVRTGGFSGLIPTVVPEPVLPEAYGVEAASYNIAGIAGPAIAGAVAGTAGARWAIVATGVTALTAVVAIARVAIPPGRTAAGERLRAALRDGLTLLWRVRSLRAVTVTTTAGQAAFGLVVVGFPLLAAALGHDRSVGGLLFSVDAVGALCGSLVWSRLAGRIPEEPAVMVATLLLGVAMVGLAAAPSLTVALLAAAGAGLFDGPLLAATLNLRQRVAPEELRTQVFTTAASLKIGSFAVGAALAGPLAAALGARGLLASIAVGQLLAVLTGLLARRA